MRFRSIDEVSPMIACGLVVSRTSICLVFSSVIAAAQEATNRERTPRETAVVAIVDSTAKSFEAKGFSGTILLRHGDKTLLLRGYGFQDCARKRSMNPDAVMDIGSVSKVMTATAVLDLVGQHKLSLTDSLARFFPAAPADKAAITIEELLRHTSGLPESLGKDEDYVSRDWLVGHALSAPLVAKPGESEHYSNTGYAVLAAVIESVSGLSFEQYLTQRQFAPIGLTRTGYTLPKWRPEELMCGSWDGKAYGATRDYFHAEGPSWHLMGNGGIHSTAGELADWFDALFKNRLHPPPVFRHHQLKSAHKPISSGSKHR
jgi:CubicO group peptidase (beta-lactamase class C family)